MDLLSHESMYQYQLEEQSLIARRVKNDRDKLRELLKAMIKDEISSPEKIDQLKEELNKHHKTTVFTDCKSMGELVMKNLLLLIQKEFKQSIY